MLAASSTRGLGRLALLASTHKAWRPAGALAMRGLAGSRSRSSNSGSSRGSKSLRTAAARIIQDQPHHHTHAAAPFSVSALQHPPLEMPPSSSSFSQQQQQQDQAQAQAPSSSPSPSPSPSGNGKIVPFLLADIGEGIAEVEMMQWFVREGDVVKQFDRVCEVQSDKATVEISSRYDGVVRRVHHQIGAVVKVGSALVDIEVMASEADIVAASAAASPASSTTAAPPPSLSTMNNADLPPPPIVAAAAAATTSEPFLTSPPLITPVSPQGHAAPTTSMLDEIIPTTPAVRRLAKEYGVDLALVQPTGPQARVLKGDVLEYIRLRGLGLAPTNPNSPSTTNTQLPSPLPSPTTTTTHTAPLPILTPSPLSATHLTQPTRVPIRGIMRQMVKSMNASLKIPHFGYQDEVCMDKATLLRDALRPLAHAQGIQKLSYLPLMLKAASLAMLQFPILNASLSPDETEVIYHPDHHIGIAMDTNKGLVVPVLRAVQTKSVFEIARELIHLQTLAANGGFTEEHFVGATFTFSNIGSIGGTYMDAKIVPPQVAIGAVGRIQTLPRFATHTHTHTEGGGGGVGGMVVVPTKVVAISWAGDHRVIDGATMANFSNLWKLYMEEPAAMLAETK